jgi:hypothetical protein
MGMKERLGFGQLSATHQDKYGVICHNSADPFMIVFLDAGWQRFGILCVAAAQR